MGYDGRLGESEPMPYPGKTPPPDGPPRKLSCPRDPTHTGREDWSGVAVCTNCPDRPALITTTTKETTGRSSDDPFRPRRSAKARYVRGLAIDMLDAASAVFGLHLAIDNLGGFLHWLGLALVWMAVLNLAWADR